MSTKRTKSRAALTLSKRMRQVLDRAGRGFTNKEIAQDLGIAERTVEEYRAQIVQRMGASNITEAAVAFERYKSGFSKGTICDQAQAGATFRIRRSRDQRPLSPLREPHAP